MSVAHCWVLKAAEDPLSFLLGHSLLLRCWRGPFAINYSLCTGQIIISRKATWRRGRLRFMRRDVSLKTAYIRGKTGPNLPHLVSQETHSPRLEETTAPPVVTAGITCWLWTGLSEPTRQLRWVDLHDSFEGKVLWIGAPMLSGSRTNSIKMNDPLALPMKLHQVALQSLLLSPKHFQFSVKQTLVPL